MCVSIILHNFIKDYPLILANNRDEMIDRNFAPPSILHKKPLIIGGIDLKKNGTWLGINEHNILINILNKWKENTPFSGADNYKSRGILVLDLLKESNIETIINKVKEISYNEYLPFYLIVSNLEKVYFIEFDEYINVKDISNQNFIAGNQDPFSNWEKFNTGKTFLKALKAKEIFTVRKTLKQLLKFQKGDFSIPSTDYSVNLGKFQTTSSTIVEINKNKINYLFANGKPISNEYQNYSYLFKGVLK